MPWQKNTMGPIFCLVQPWCKSKWARSCASGSAHMLLLITGSLGLDWELLQLCALSLLQSCGSARADNFISARARSKSGLSLALDPFVPIYKYGCGNISLQWQQVQNQDWTTIWTRVWSWCCATWSSCVTNTYHRGPGPVLLVGTCVFGSITFIEQYLCSLFRK